MALIEAVQNNAVVFYGVVAFLGLFVGSFLNVVIYRLPIMMHNEWTEAMQEMAAEQAASHDADNEAQNNSPADSDSLSTEDDTKVEPFNLSVPRSRCPDCNNLITWWQNIPVLSYLLLAGKCFKCKKPISIRYPAVEMVTMLLSLVVAWQFGPTLMGVLGIVVTWFFVAMTMIDFDHHLLPDSLTLPLMWIGLLAALIPVFTDLRSAVIGAAAGYLALWLIYQSFKLITGKEGMGFGDFKLLAALGALLGWQHLVTIMLLSSVVGAIVGLSLIALTGRDKSVPMPFGPYLTAAGWIAMVWGDNIMNLYFGSLA